MEGQFISVQEGHNFLKLQTSSTHSCTQILVQINLDHITHQMLYLLSIGNSPSTLALDTVAQKRHSPIGSHVNFKAPQHASGYR